MRLSKIKLAGFKSFVDPTTINLLGNLSAIVGPNGCGKSNVIDAVRWVMGESSAKNLRGGQLIDVIFNGSTSRKPLGQASVDLIFDNSMGSLGGEYAKFSEISIRRMVTRDGQSAYYLNGTRCRRKDITDVFSGTGLGKNSGYAIIEQGMVSKFILAKPEEMRSIVEEASGISKYKERRRETETRIKHTRENLERLTDLRNELDKQMLHLHKQAQAAQTFKVLRAKERLCSALHAALVWQNLDTNIRQIEQSLLLVTNEVEHLKTQRQTLETELEKLRVCAHDSQEKLNQTQNAYYQSGNEITRLEQTLKHHQLRKDSLEKNQIEAKDALEKTRLQLTLDETRIQELKAQMEQLTPLLEENKVKTQEALQNVVHQEQMLEEWRSSWQALNQQLEMVKHQAEVEKVKISQLEKQVHQAKTREQKLTQEFLELKQAQIDNAVIELEDSIQEMLETLEVLDAQLSDGQAQKRFFSDEIQERKKEVKNKEKILQQTQARLTSLEALQSATQTQQNKTIQSWIEKMGLASNQKLYQTIEVEPKWLHALEMILGENIESLLIESNEQATILQSIEEFKEGSLNFIVLTPVLEIQDDPFPRLVNCVKTPIDALLHSLLSGIYLAETEEAAYTKVAFLKPHESIITPQGVWMGPNWIKLKGKGNIAQSVLERQSEIKNLMVNLAQREKELHELKEILKNNEMQLNELEETREAVQFERNQVYKRLMEDKATLTTKKDRLNHLKVRMLQIQTELEESKVLFQNWQNEIDTAREVVAHTVERMASFEEQRKQLEPHKQLLQQQIKFAKEEENAVKLKEHAIALQINQFATELKATYNNIDRFEAHIESFTGRLKQIEQDKLDNEEPVARLQLQLETQCCKQLEIENLLSVARDAANDYENKIREVESSRQFLEKSYITKRETLEKEKMHWQGMTVRKENALEKIKETDFELKDLLAQLPNDKTEQDYVQEVEKLNNQIQKLGAINLAAIEEYEAQKERKNYLDTQNNDLQEALGILENAIIKIDKETRLRFQDTFNRINNNFKELFPKLFGGGQSYLELTSDDLLETGITVFARPPGKKNSTIHLLSGGEKALTAMALVFSIFQLNPAPFCMLDEVDAPLDDYNVGRLCNLIKSMSQSLQFIYISHNKLALEMADQLQGVTMKEPGVSRIVTVDVEEARSLAEA